MKKSFPIISFVAMSFVAASAHPGYPKMYTQEEKIYALGVCWSELKFNFVGIEDITFDLDSPFIERRSIVSLKQKTMWNSIES